MKVEAATARRLLCSEAAPLAAAQLLEPLISEVTLYQYCNTTSLSSRVLSTITEGSKSPGASRRFRDSDQVGLVPLHRKHGFTDQDRSVGNAGGNFQTFQAWRLLSAALDSWRRQFSVFILQNVSDITDLL